VIFGNIGGIWEDCQGLFFQDGIPEELLKQICHSIKDNRILGQDSFVKGIENNLYLKRRS
jgi:hypothetical protein